MDIVLSLTYHISSISCTLKYCLGATTTSEIDAVIKNFTDRLYHKRNARNLRAFVQSFRARTELTHDDLNAMRPNVLLVTGKEASFNHTVRGFTVYRQSVN